jgi:hypothetical protein
MEHTPESNGCPFGDINAEQPGTVLSNNVPYLNWMSKINLRAPAANTDIVTPLGAATSPEEFQPWFAPDEQMGEAVEIRKAAYYANPDRVLNTNNNDPAIRIVSELLLNLQAKDLATNFPNYYELDEGVSITNKITQDTYSLQPTENDLHPLAISGLLSQEDLCLVRQTDDGRQIFEAGFLATPTKWHLDMFLGMDMDGIHGDIGGYNEKLKKAVDSMMLNLPEYPKKQIVRNNLFLYLNSPLALLPDGLPDFNPEDITDPGNQIFLRSERETLTRMPAIKRFPDSNLYTLFTIEPRVFALKTIKENMNRKKLEKLIGALQTNTVLTRKALIAEKALAYLQAAA